MRLAGARDTEREGAMTRRPSFLLAVAALLVLSTGILQFREVRRIVREKDAPKVLPTGSAAPELSVPAVGGGTVRLADFKGKIVIVSFWATWCLPCRAEMPQLVTFVESWNRDRTRKNDLAYLAINFKEDAAELRPVLRDERFKHVTFAIDGDGKTSERWNADAIPTTYVIAPDGSILDGMRGFDLNLEYRLRRVLLPYKSESPGSGAGS